MRSLTQQSSSVLTPMHPPLATTLETGPLLFSARRRSRRSRRARLILVALVILEVVALVTIYLLVGMFFPQ